MTSIALTRLDIINMEVGMMTIIKYYYMIFMFFLAHAQAVLKTEEARSKFLLLCDPHVLSIIRLRAQCCKEWLRPVMKISGGILRVQPHAKRMKEWRMRLETQFGDNSQVLMPPICTAPLDVIIPNDTIVETVERLSRTLVSESMMSNFVSTFHERHPAKNTATLSQVLDAITSDIDLLNSIRDGRANTTHTSLNNITQLFSLETNVLRRPSLSSIDALCKLTTSQDQYEASSLEPLHSYIRKKAYTYGTALRLQWDKHITKTIDSALKVPSDEMLFAGPTNRTGETRFGVAKNYLKYNSKTSAFLLECHVRAVDFTPIEIYAAMEKYSGKCSLSYLVNELLPLLPKERDIDRMHAIELKHKQTVTGLDSISALFKQLVHIMISDFSGKKEDWSVGILHRFVKEKVNPLHRHREI